MERQTFKTMIDAPREKVWDILWNGKTYREWTSVFSEGSTAETDWKEGSKILFLDGNGQGMVSRIARRKENEFMSFEHLGEVRDGVEHMDATAWTGATEDYTLKSIDGRTELTVEIDMTDEHKDYFMEAWPKAFDKLKAIVERTRAGTVA